MNAVVLNASFQGSWMNEKNFTWEERRRCRGQWAGGYCCVVFVIQGMWFLSMFLWP